MSQKITMFLSKNALHLVFFVALVVSLTPWIILGEHTPMGVHDHLDANYAYFKMFQDANIWFDLAGPVPALDNLSIVYFPWAQFSLQSLIYAFLPVYWAQVFAMAVSMAFAYYFSKLLINTIIPQYANSYIILGTSFLFCILPNYYSWGIAVASMPLIFVCFYWLAQYDCKVFPKIALLLVFYPFISAFGMMGIFILCLWFLGCICMSLYHKKIHFPLCIGFITLTVGYILVDMRLFYMRFILSEPLNRIVSASKEIIFIEQFEKFCSFFSNLIWGNVYHAPSIHWKILAPFVLGTFIISCVYMVGRYFKLPIIIQFFDKYFSRKETLTLYFSVCLFLLACILISAFGSTLILGKIFSVILPPLQGVNFARFFLFSRLFWYVAFALSLCIWIYDFRRHDFFFFLPKILLAKTSIIFLVLLVFSLQVCLIFKHDSYYSILSKESYIKILQQNNLIEPNQTNAETFIPMNSFQKVSPYDYYAPTLFEIIKNDIAYDNENVLGFHLDPVILTYNGIRTPGGYRSIYPLVYMEKFRKLLEPEFEVNHQRRDYFDSWGGRLYLYNDDIATTGYTLRINGEALRNDFDVKYIFSSVMIENAMEIGLELHKKFTEQNSRYAVYVYKVCDF